MTAGFDLAQLIELAVSLVLVGAFAGFFAGVFGIGGGAVLVPVFYECFRLVGVPVHFQHLSTAGSVALVAAAFRTRSYTRTIASDSPTTRL